MNVWLRNYLEGLLCRLFGNPLQEGIADDLYSGSDNPSELFNNRRRVPQALHGSGLVLSANGIVVAPASTMMRD